VLIYACLFEDTIPGAQRQVMAGIPCDRDQAAAVWVLVLTVTASRPDKNPSILLE
jgi:hypothetical protein